MSSDLKNLSVSDLKIYLAKVSSDLENYLVDVNTDLQIYLVEVSSKLRDLFGGSELILKYFD